MSAFARFFEDFAKRIKPRPFTTFVCVACVIVLLQMLSLRVRTRLRPRKHFNVTTERTQLATAAPTPTTVLATTVPPSSAPMKHGFQLVYPFVEPKLNEQERSYYLVVMIVSTPNHRRLRDSIRKSWGNVKTSVDNNSPKQTWRAFFCLAVPPNKAEHEANLKEAAEFNDIIIGNTTDTYMNLVMKTFMSFNWVNFRLNSKYVLKADDDVYVRVPELIRYLQASNDPTPFYGGVIDSNRRIVRDPNKPWYVSYDLYNATSYPPWCHGGFYVVSGVTLPKYLKHVYVREPFRTEDTYVAVSSYELGVKAVHIDGFRLSTNRRWTGQELKSNIAFGHQLTTIDFLRMHRELSEMYKNGGKSKKRR